MMAFGFLGAIMIMIFWKMYRSGEREKEKG